MQFNFIANACGIFTGSNGTRLLMDPWIKDGVFEGSWFHYPPIKTQPEDLLDVDGIYVSHIHPDHFDERTFVLFRKDIPIFILGGTYAFLVRRLAAIGFKNIHTISDGDTIVWKEFKLTIFGPFVRHPFHECEVGNMVDTALVIQDGNQVALNANDNTLDDNAAIRIKERFGHITLAMLNYNNAGPYPACFLNLTETQRYQMHRLCLTRNFVQMARVADILECSFVLPFAGAYVLGGKHFTKNCYLGTTTWDEAYTYLTVRGLKASLPIRMREHQGIDLNTGAITGEYIPVPDSTEYIRSLSHVRYPYESDPAPDLDALYDDLFVAGTLMEKRMKSYGLKTTFSVSVNAQTVLQSLESTFHSKVLTCILDERLLRRILDKKAHWNNAEIGCHIEFYRSPDVYEPDLHNALQFLHL